MLRIKESVITAIIAHAEREAPCEACGYLAAEDGLVNRHYELTNTDKAADHFSMDPGEQFAAVKDMRARGLKYRAVYHSHPETPARPSAEDIRLAYDPDISYVIVSLAENDRAVKSFLIRRGEVTAEPVEVVAGDGAAAQTDTMEDAVTKTADAFKSCRGVGCPMNLVYTKVELAKLKPGQILELILDDGPPINNVPGSVRREGHKILEQKQLEDGTWLVLIEK